MSWRDQLQAASFRGVPFKTTEAKTTVGRRAVITQFPLRDLPDIEDLGAETDVFTITAYVIGPDYMSARDALITALKTSGPGVLVHPYYGSISVQVSGQVSIDESTRDGGRATFTIPFTAAAQVNYPVADPATAAGAQSAAVAAGTASGTAFGTDFVTADQADFVSSAAADNVSDLIDTLTSVASSISTLPDELSSFIGQAEAVSGALSSLIYAPVTLYSELDTLYAQCCACVDDVSGAYAGLKTLFDYGSTATLPTATTPSRMQQAANQLAVQALAQQLATTYATQMVAQMTFASSADAIAVRDALIDQIDTLTDAVTDDALYDALCAMRAALSLDIQVRAANLAARIEVTLPDTLPALVLAWRQYADATRTDDVCARNAVVDPLWLPSGMPLELTAS